MAPSSDGLFYESVWAELTREVGRLYPEMTVPQMEAFRHKVVELVEEVAIDEVKSSPARMKWLIEWNAWIQCGKYCLH